MPARSARVTAGDENAAPVRPAAARSNVVGLQAAAHGAEGHSRQAVNKPPSQDTVQRAAALATAANTLAQQATAAAPPQAGLRAHDSNAVGSRGSRFLRPRDPNTGASPQAGLRARDPNAVGSRGSRLLRPRDPNTGASPQAGSRGSRLLRPRDPNTGAAVVGGRSLRPRDPSTGTVATQAREAAPVQSMSNLLASRSENSSRPTRRSSASSTPSAAPSSPALIDIDAADHGDWMHETKYVNDIYAYYKKVEHVYHVMPEYMSEQADINERMRAILIDWLVEVHLKFKLMPETLFLTVQIIDRYLAIDTVSRRNLQLVGVTAMLIASKYEEIWAPEVRDFVFICDRAYTRDQILGMEKVILNKLQFKITSPTSYHFLARFIKACGQTEKSFNMLCMYAIEIAFPDYKMLKYSYSKLSAAAVLVARERMGTGPWTRELQHHTGYSEAELQECAATMKHLMTAAGRSGVSLRAVHKKYSNPRFFEVALLFPPNPQ